MPLFDESYLNRLIDKAERELSIRTGIIFDRFSLPVTLGQGILDLPTGVIGIVQVTWKGEEVIPQDFLEFDGNYLKPQALMTSSKPKMYIRVMNGYAKIQLVPKPNETLVGGTDTFAALASLTLIKTRLVISAIRSANPASETLRMPTYLFRNCMKYKALAEAYAKEGKTQNLVASEYFLDKFTFFLMHYEDVMRKFPKAITNTLQPTNGIASTKIPKGSLPSDGPWSF